MILRLRQLCAHAILLVRKEGEAPHHDEYISHISASFVRMTYLEYGLSLLLEAGDDRLANHTAFHDNQNLNRDDEMARVGARIDSRSRVTLT